MMNAMSIRAGASLGAIVIAFSARAARAVPLTVEFEGHLVWVTDPFDELDSTIYVGSGGNPGTPFTGGFTYDPEMPGPDDLPDDPSIGSYLIDYELWLEAGSVSISISPFRMAVWNDSSSVSSDLLQALAGPFDSNGQLFDYLIVNFQDLPGTLYDEIDLPQTIAFEDFSLVSFALTYDGNNPRFGGWMESMTITPEPSGAIMIGLGFLLLISHRGNQVRV